MNTQKQLIFFVQKYFFSCIIIMIFAIGSSSTSLHGMDYSPEQAAVACEKSINSFVVRNQINRKAVMEYYNKSTTKIEEKLSFLKVENDHLKVFYNFYSNHVKKLVKEKCIDLPNEEFEQKGKKLNEREEKNTKKIKKIIENEQKECREIKLKSSLDMAISALVALSAYIIFRELFVHSKANIKLL